MTVTSSGVLAVRPLPRSWALALALAACWALAAPLTPDLAAQVYRTWLFGHHGFVVWDNAWYGGHHMPGYSLVFPPLASLLGLRLTGLLAATGSAALFELILRRLGAQRVRLACGAFAVCCVGDLLVGRLTYALGVTVGLGAIAALVSGHRRLAVALALACGPTSPVAGVFLALAATVLFLTQRRPGAPAVAAAAVATVGGLALAFPEGGTEPFSPTALLTLVAVCAGATAVLAPARRGLRLGAVLYAAGAIASFVVASPLGGNVTRLGTAFAVPLLIAVGPRPGRRAAVLFAIVLAGGAVWQWSEVLSEARKGVDDPTASRAYYRDLTAQLRLEGAARGRVEVPFTRNHWESAFLARTVPLARGWERQLDRRLNPVFYGRRPLTAARYRTWLRRNGVGFVALPGAPMDPAGAQEARLVAAGLPYLRLVWRSADWRLYRVVAPAPLVTGPGTLIRLDTTGVRLRVRHRGALVLRVHWSPYWRVASGAACVTGGRDGWTHVAAARPGVVVLRARLSLQALLGDHRRCGPRR
ncbi:MAG TPA: hypothetical protein VGO71_00720 [Baekduia sp.]|jgi:hypothetical protein|nr:hypothetical protein [Baekduia sp.]